VFLLTPKHIKLLKNTLIDELTKCGRLHKNQYLPTVPFDQFFVDNPVLQATVALAVDLEFLRIKNMSSSCWPMPNDWVNCRTCYGIGTTEKHGRCLDCLGKGSMLRNEAISLAIASYGDDLQYGGPNCKRAFKAVVDAFVLLKLWAKIR